MNRKISINLCTRCGKERIVSKTWVEELETRGRMMVITHSESICPDAGCQTKVAQGLTDQRRRREEVTNRKKNGHH